MGAWRGWLGPGGGRRTARVVEPAGSAPFGDVRAIPAVLDVAVSADPPGAAGGDVQPVGYWWVGVDGGVQPVGPVPESGLNRCASYPQVGAVAGLSVAGGRSPVSSTHSNEERVVWLVEKNCIASCTNARDAPKHGSSE